MSPSTVSAATGTSDADDACPTPGITQEEPDAIVAGLLHDCDYGLSDRDARDVLIGCLRDLSGSPAAALPELAFRLMCQRIRARSENAHESTTIGEAGQIRSTQHVA